MLEALVRKTLIVAAAGALTLALSGAAAAQDPNSNGTSGTPRIAAQTSPAQPNTQTDSSTPTSQPTSLADVARLVRAKKQGEPKPVKVIDDDNLSRGGSGISVVGNAASDSAADSGGQGIAGRRSGKMVLLDFWATWCGPCRESVPDLKQLQATYGRDQLEVISISADKDEGAWRSFVAQNQMNWEQQIDSSGEMRRQYNVNAFPTFILMDAGGRVVHRFVGEDPQDPIASRIAPYLSGAPLGGS